MTDWESRWRAGDTPWDKGEAAPPLIEGLEQWWSGDVRGWRVLVPGCGSGHDVRALARAGAGAVGLDLSATAVERARAVPRVADETYEAGDFFQWGTEAGFDAVWEHTCFCAIEPVDRPRYAEAAGRLIRPGGRLIGVFYLDPWRGEVPQPPPFGATVEEIVEVLDPWFALVRGRVPERTYPGREGAEWLAEFVRRDGGVAGSGKDR